jgi:hypothetical protein
MTHPPPAYARPQRGAAALAVSMVLLFGMTLVAFFANRGIIFEQKTSANQMRSTRAFEAAEAGLEWATAMVNDSRVINTSCIATSGQPTSFRDKYTPAGSPTNLTPVANSRPGCRIRAAGDPVCSCPAGGATADFTTAAFSVTTTSDPNFTVEFTDVASDPESVIVTSYGCVNQTAPCTAANNAAGDATARVTVMLKLRPIIRAAPSAALTTGGWAQICGSFNITNTTANANGYLVNSGGQTQIGNGTYQSGPLPPGAPNCGGGGGQTLATTPGTPIANSIVANDTSLSSISGNSQNMFASFFGTTLAQFRAAPTTFTVTGNNAGARATNLINAYSAGWRSFWIDGDIQFSGNLTLGSAAQPVLMVSESDMSFNGNYNIYGVIYSDSADWNDLGTGTSNIYGAVLTRLNYRNNGNGTIVYDPLVLGNVRDTGVLVRVPGSWRDF